MSVPDMTQAALPPSEASGDLGRLLATEERLERRLADARAEARRLVAAAEADGAAATGRLEAELADLERQVGAEAGAEEERRCREIEAEARAEIATYDAVDGARVTALAQHVVARVLGAAPA